ETLLIVLRQLDSFRGESRLTTWAYTVLVNLMADEQRRRAWRHRQLDDSSNQEKVPVAAQQSLERLAERHAVWAIVRDAIDHDLTARQRRVLIGRIFQQQPLVVLADELGTDKDNIYKVLHDARKHLKRALLSRGLTVAEALAAFQEAPL